MPQRGKAKRVASTQGKLSQRRRRQPRPRAEGSLIAAPETEVQPAGPSSADGAPVEARPTTAAQPVPSPAPVVRRGPTRQEPPRPSVYRHIQPEIKRILALTSVMAVALIVLAVFLR